MYYALNTSSSSLCVKERSAASYFYKYIILAYISTNIDEGASLSVESEFSEDGKRYLGSRGVVLYLFAWSFVVASVLDYNDTIYSWVYYYFINSSV